MFRIPALLGGAAVDPWFAGSHTGATGHHVSQLPIPSYRRHRASGLAVVTLSGKDHYLGHYGTPESLEAYRRVTADWLRQGRQLPNRDIELTIGGLVTRFLEHADVYYRRAGTSTGEAGGFRLAARPLLHLFRTMRASDFAPRHLKLLQQEMIGLDWNRNVINRQICRVRMIFKWAVSEELVASTVWEALRSVAPIRPERTAARESEPIRPVPLENVLAIEQHVSPQVWALVQLQLFTGARAGELLMMRAVDIETRDGEWVYRPQHHKTAHRQKDRPIYLGPKARLLIEPFLASRSIDAYLFSAAEADAFQRAARHAARRTSASCGNRPGTNLVAVARRAPRDRYDTNSYRRAIQRGCIKAGVPNWHPHQLRHNVGTLIRRQFGLEVAQAVLGHSTLRATQVYAELNRDRARMAIAEIG
jgi:integrase